MLKVMVIGCPGSGKSTFSRKLSEVTNIPLYYLDMLFHKADRSNASRDEFDEKLNQILEKESWIIDGNYQRTLFPRLESCDTVFLLDLPLEVCLAAAQSRIGKERADMPWIETEFDEEFKQYILDFPNEQLPEIYKKLALYPNKKIVIFKSRNEIDEYIKQLCK